MVIEMTNVVAFQPFSPSKLQQSIVNAEAARPLERKKNFMLNLNLSRIRSEYPGRYSANQNAPLLINKSSLIGENNMQWTQKILQRPASVEQQSNKSDHGCCQKPCRSIYRRIKREFRGHVFFSKQSIIALVCHFYGSSNWADQ